MDRVPRVSIVIVTWNATAYIERCLSSLWAACEGLQYEVFVVDNASADATPRLVGERFPWVTLMENRENVGFARAANRGLAAARGQYLLLLNPDTVLVEKNVLTDWLAYMDGHPEVGASGVRLVLADGRHQLGDAGHRPTLATTMGHFWFLSRLSRDRIRGVFLIHADAETALDVDWISGAAFLVRSSIVRELGALEEHFFMFGEDMEWGCRIRDHGHAVRYLPDLAVAHLQGSAVAESGRSDLSVMWLRNLRALFQRYNPRSRMVLFDGIVGSGLALRVMLHGLRALLTRDAFARRRARELWAALRALLRGFGRWAEA
jgi:N-acetylglucosaminyl-diphospho-decaprenol L-rhamnosyltransferase